MQPGARDTAQALKTEYEMKKAPFFKQRAEIVAGSAVPKFWLQALQNNVMVAEEITKADEGVLAYLEDIKCSTDLGAGKKGFQLAFVFAENPYFADKILTKVGHLLKLVAFCAKHAITLAPPPRRADLSA